jgi:hypothetical protein
MELPKLYRQVYIAVWFEQPRMAFGEYDPAISIEYFKARTALNESREVVWVLIDELPDERDFKCMIVPDFNDWHYKNPKPYKPNLTRGATPTIKEINNDFDWDGLF